MKCENEVRLTGYVGADPEIKFTPKGTKVAYLNVATTKKWKDKTSGEKKESTQWHRCVAWQGLAEIIEKYVSKGSPVIVRGELQHRSYEKDGEKRYVTEVHAFDVNLLPTREGRESGAPEATAGDPDAITDDDIPF